jgi:ATP-binding cassette, subfamily C, bacterial CydD
MSTKVRGPLNDVEVEVKRGLSIESGADYIKLFDRRMLDLGKGELKKLWGVVLFGLLIATTYILQSLAVAGVLQKVLSGNPYSDIFLLIAILIILIMFRSILIFVNDWVSSITASRISISLRDRLYDKLIDLGPGWLLTQKSGVLQATIIDGSEALQNYFGRFLPQVLISITAGVIVVALLFSIDPVIGLVMGTVIVVTLLQPVIVWRGMGTKQRIWFVVMPQLFSEYLDNLQGIVTLKSFSASRYHGEKLYRKTDDLLKTEIGINADEIVWSLPFSLVFAMGSAVAITIGAFRMNAGALSIGGLLLVLLLVGEALRPISELRKTFHFSIKGMGAAEGVLDILEAEPPVREDHSSIISKALEPSVSFENVTFRYRKEDMPAIDHLTYTVRPGEHIALVGRSGSGKTTAISLLLRFNDPQEGVIRIGGQDTRRIPLEKLRAQFAVVSQDSYLFHGTIRENLLLAKPDALDIELDEAVKAASGFNFIHALPQGYDTIVGERGLKLSGGERQRISIARALLKNAPILILDEATSSVDIENESLIQEALSKITHGRTTIIIAHRLSTIRNVDTIYVLEKGQMIEKGTHDELVKVDGAYHSLIKAEEN